MQAVKIIVVVAVFLVLARFAKIYARKLCAVVCFIYFWIENDPPSFFGTFPKIHRFLWDHPSLLFILTNIEILLLCADLFYRHLSMKILKYFTLHDFSSSKITRDQLLFIFIAHISNF